MSSILLLRNYSNFNFATSRELENRSRRRALPNLDKAKDNLPQFAFQNGERKMWFNNLICHNLAAFIKNQNKNQRNNIERGRGNYREGECVSLSKEICDDDESENWDWNWNWDWDSNCGIGNSDYDADKRLPKWTLCWNVISPILTPIENWRCYQWKLWRIRRLRRPRRKRFISTKCGGRIVSSLESIIWSAYY